MELLAARGTGIEGSHGDDPAAAEHAEPRDPGLVGAPKHIDDDIGVDRVGSEPAPDLLHERRSVEARGSRLQGDHLGERAHRVGSSSATGRADPLPDGDDEHGERKPPGARHHRCADDTRSLAIESCRQRNRAAGAYMGMMRVVVLASSLAVCSLALLACGCNGDGLQATVGIVGQACVASVDGADPCGASLACGTDGRCVPAGYALATPTVAPLGETSARITWTAATGRVAWYEVRVAPSPTAAPVAVPGFAHVAPGTTSVILTDLAPGTLGRVVVAAAIPGASAVAAPSSILWTPFGAINEDSVNSVTPLTGYAGAPYAEGDVRLEPLLDVLRPRLRQGSVVRLRRDPFVADRDADLQLRQPDHQVRKRLQPIQMSPT